MGRHSWSIIIVELAMSQSHHATTGLNNPNCNGRTTIIGGVLGDEMTSREIMKQLFT